ncbi:MAG: asparagine synthetase B family protein [Rhodothalassiaceae bacterium]
MNLSGGLCGWQGGAVGGDEAAVVLTRMAAALPATPGARITRWTGGGAALAVSGGSPGALAEANGLAAAIVGHPRWRDEAIAARAAETGHAAALIAAWRSDGAACLARLEGDFSLALVDTGTGTLLLAIDRVGIGRMAQAAAGDGALVFGTSIDAVRAHPAVSTRLSPAGLYRFAMNYVSPAPGTVFEGIEKLLPAHRLVRRGTAAAAIVEPYWRIPYGAEEGAGIPLLRERLFAHLEKAVARAAAGVPAERRGAFLSGGLDSSTVCGILQRQSPGPVPAFTVVFAEEQYNEGPYARIAAAHFGLDHREYCLTPADAHAFLHEAAAAFDEPYSNSSVIPAFYCARMAREQGIGRLLAGDGGDEIFAGNRRYAEQAILGHYDRLPGFARTLLERLLLPLPAALERTPLGKIKRYIDRARMPMPERMHNPKVYARERLGDVFTADMLEAIDPEEPYALWRRHYEDAGTGDMLASMLHLDMRITIADNDLRKVNTACRLAGIDVTYPMLDEDLVSFAASIPARLLLKGTRLRHFYREATRGFLPDAILDKRKHGFGMPFGEWMRNEPRLRAVAEDCLCTLAERGIFRRDFLRHMKAEHDRPERTHYDGLLWDMVMLELWLRDRRLSVG